MAHTSCSFFANATKDVFFAAYGRALDSLTP